MSCLYHFPLLLLQIVGLGEEEKQKGKGKIKKYFTLFLLTLAVDV
jgi:hypothetical protein